MAQYVYTAATVDEIKAIVEAANAKNQRVAAMKPDPAGTWVLLVEDKTVRVGDKRPIPPPPGYVERRGEAPPAPLSGRIEPRRGDPR